MRVLTDETDIYIRFVNNKFIILFIIKYGRIVTNKQNEKKKKLIFYCKLRNIFVYLQMAVFPAILGFFGGIILSIQMFPQIYKILNTKSTKDISTSFLILNIVGLACMTGYGVVRNDLPLYVPTSISLCNTMIVLILKIVYSCNNEI